MYLASSVALGDLCVAPKDYLLHKSPPNLQVEVLKYYLACDPSHMNPFTQKLREAQRAVDAMAANLIVVNKIADELYRATLEQRLRVLVNDIGVTKE